MVKADSHALLRCLGDAFFLLGELGAQRGSAVLSPSIGIRAQSSLIIKFLHEAATLFSPLPWGRQGTHCQWQQQGALNWPFLEDKTLRETLQVGGVVTTTTKAVAETS